MILNIALLITIFFGLMSSIVLFWEVIYSEQPDHAPVSVYSVAGSTQSPVVKKLISPS